MMHNVRMKDYIPKFFIGDFEFRCWCHDTPIPQTENNIWRTESMIILQTAHLWDPTGINLAWTLAKTVTLQNISISLKLSKWRNVFNDIWMNNL